ncbi:hypothetical protein G7046_g9364 [Stylonectria norvegica]|nr:hypothetical protein G7046_g9364 [Stylonectria norvegica]
MAMIEQSFAMFPNRSDTEEFVRYPDNGHAVFTSGPSPMDLSIPGQGFGSFPRSGHEVYPTTMGFESSLYAEAPNVNYMLNSRASPGMYPDEQDMRVPSSSLSSASAPSAASSTMGSPQSHHGQMGGVPEWTPHGLGVQPTIVGNDYMAGSEYSTFAGPGMEELAFDFGQAKGFVGELDDASTAIPPRCPEEEEEDYPPSCNTRMSASASASAIASSTPHPTHSAFPSPFPSRASPAARHGSAADCAASVPSSTAVTSTPNTTLCPAKRPLSASAISPTETFRWRTPPAAPQHSHSQSLSQSGCLSLSHSAGRRAAFFSPQRSGVSSAPLPPSCSLSHPRYSSASQVVITASGTTTMTMTMIADSAPPSTDPSLINPEIHRPHMGIPSYDAHFHQNAHPFPASPSAVSSSSPQPNMMRTNSSSPFLHSGPFQTTFPNSPYGAPMDSHARRPSMGQFVPPTPGEYVSGDETKEKRRCTYPECGKVFKDLKAHMLTHQNERPEKCPIQTCEYHVKGFARKYDKNRHTLTHYKGTMVCGFCPGSGSAAEKSFNRADVFKRHLTAVHGVEQTPPNSRKKATNVNTGKKLSGYASDATGKCSTCSQTFSNAQDFYEHLDDCVLRIVQQEDPAEAINAKRLAEVENDADVHETLEKNNLPTVTETTSAEEEDEEMETADEDDTEASSKTSLSPSAKKKGNPANGVQKSKGMTHSRGGVALTGKTRGRKNRRDYPSSWGFDKGQMTMKKRVMAVFDGPRRLAKDDMMLSTDHEVRIKLSDGKAYVTDLDVQTLKRADGFHGATAEEKGSWISDDPTEEQLREMQNMLERSHTRSI